MINKVVWGVKYPQVTEDVRKNKVTVHGLSRVSLLNCSERLYDADWSKTDLILLFTNKRSERCKQPVERGFRLTVTERISRSKSFVTCDA